MCLTIILFCAYNLILLLKMQNEKGISFGTNLDMNQVLQILFAGFALYIVYMVCSWCMCMIYDQNEGLDVKYPSMDGRVAGDHYGMDYDGIVPTDNFDDMGMATNTGGVADRTPDDYTKSLVQSAMGNSLQDDDEIKSHIQFAKTIAIESTLRQPIDTSSGIMTNTTIIPTG
jgi:hypothetical protein